MSRLRSFYEGKKVLVTGHTGFKGAWLSEWLLDMGAAVSGYALEPEADDSIFNLLGLASRIQHQIGDIRDRETFSKALSQGSFDCIFHLAAQPLVRESYRQPLQTCETNIMGTCHLLEAVRTFQKPCSLVVVTTDKCYENREHLIGYSEGDHLGGRDIYSASKAAVEIMTHAYRSSFFYDSPVRIATARAGNVIGGGDVAKERIFTDAVLAFRSGSTLKLRNPASTRPWQHVLEPLSGYLWLGAMLGDRTTDETDLCSAFNFGPSVESNKTVLELAQELAKNVDLHFEVESPAHAVVFHEAKLLHLNNEKAKKALGWVPVWNFEDAVKHSADWYSRVGRGEKATDVTRQDIEAYEADASALGLSWSLKN